MTVKIIRTSALTGAALDWAVTYAIGGIVKNKPSLDGSPHWEAIDQKVRVHSSPPGATYRPRLGWIGQQHPAWPGDTRWRPSLDWKQGGELIDRLGVTVIPGDDSGTYWAGFDPVAGDGPGLYMSDDAEGQTYLEAAMRAIVLRRVGPAVSFPREFIEGNAP